MRKCILLFLFLSGILSAQQLYQLRTDDLNLVYYSTAHQYITPHLAKCCTNTLHFYQDFWQWQPWEPISIFLEDFGDWSNGGATAVPRNFIYISMAPYLYVFEVAFANERMSLLMNHEQVHIVAMDQYTAREKLWRKVFGGKIQQVPEHPVSMLYAFQTAPRKFSPRWYHEGIAVFMETWMSGGVGRALGAYDEMVFRTMVYDSSYIYHMVGLESEGTAIDFQVGANSYLYGARFFNYLAHQYGPRKLIEWVNYRPGSQRYFAHRFQQVYGTPLAEEWSQWIDFEKSWERANLERVRRNPVTPFRPIIDNKVLGSVSRSFMDSEKGLLYTGLKFPGQLAHIAAIDLESGRIRKICNLKGASTYYVTNMVFDKDQQKIYFVTDNFKYRDLNVVDLETRRQKRLIVDVRTGDLAMNPVNKAIYGVRHQNGISTLVRIDPPYDDYEALFAFPYGTDLYDLDISPDGQYMTGAMTFVDGNQKLIRFCVNEVDDYNGDYEELFDFQMNSPASFVYSPDGRYVYGTSYYSGVSNIYRYDFELSDMSIVSNAETGFFRPLPLNGDSLIVFKYTSKGFIPGWIEDKTIENVAAIRFLGQAMYEKYPYVADWHPGNPNSVPLDSLIRYKGEYKSLKNQHLTAAYPIIEGYKNSAALGYYFELRNDIGFDAFSLSASYSPGGDSLANEERLHLDLNIRHWRWELSAKYNDADFYDLFGPTKTSRKGYYLGLKYSRSLIYDVPRTMDLHWKIGGWGGLETLPDYQNVAASFDHYYFTNLNLSYKYIEKSQGAVDGEKGYALQLYSLNNLVNGQLFPRFVTTFDYGLPLPVNHTSVWLRSAAGVAPSRHNEPFANYYFGGFGNNWIDHQSEKRYREFYSFPGVELNDIGGTNFLKLTGELNLPPIRFHEIGIAALYPRWLRSSVFSSAIVTNLDDAAISRRVQNIGIQADVEIVLLSLFKTTISAGYAYAFEAGKRSGSELMLSLKIL